MQLKTNHKGTNIMLLKSLNPLFATAVYAPYLANSTGLALTGIQAIGAFIVT
jgi:hypothetical protein